MAAMAVQAAIVKNEKEKRPREGKNEMHRVKGRLALFLELVDVLQYISFLHLMTARISILAGNPPTNLRAVKRGARLVRDLSKKEAHFYIYESVLLNPLRYKRNEEWYRYIYI